MPNRPWCCPEPKCTPVFQLKDSDYEDITLPVSGESFFCFGMMEQPVAFSYDGVQHNNDLNSCSYTALKGVIRFQENESDWEALEIAYRRARQKVRDIRAAAPPESTRVAGEQGTWYCLDCDSQQPIEGAWMCSDGNVRCEMHRQEFSKHFAAAPAERYAQIAERLYGPHDRRFKVAIEVADAIRRTTTTKGDR